MALDCIYEVELHLDPFPPRFHIFACPIIEENEEDWIVLGREHRPRVVPKTWRNIFTNYQSVKRFVKEQQEELAKRQNKQ